MKKKNNNKNNKMSDDVGSVPDPKTEARSAKHGANGKVALYSLSVYSQKLITLAVK